MSLNLSHLLASEPSSRTETAAGARPDDLIEGLTAVSSMASRSSASGGIADDSLPASMSLGTTIGHVHATQDTCLVRLSAKSEEGHVLLCGDPVDTCSRRNHSHLRSDPARRGLPGVYQCIDITTNRGIARRDLVEGSFQSPEAYEATRAATLRDMARVATRDTPPAHDRNDSDARSAGVVGFDMDRKPAARRGIDDAPTPSLQRREHLDVPPPTSRVPPARLPKPAPPTTNQERPQGISAPATRMTNPSTIPDSVHSAADELMHVVRHQAALNRETMETHQRKLDQTNQTLIQALATQQEQINHLLRLESERREQATTEPTPPTAAWYVVTQGARPGVYTSRAEAYGHAGGHPDASVHSFNTHVEADNYLRASITTARHRNRTSSPLDPQVATNLHRAPPQASRGFSGAANAPTTAATTPTPPDINSMGVEGFLGEDTSRGDKKSIFGEGIDNERKMIQHLAPPHASTEVQTELAKAAIDVTSLPGKVTDERTSIEELASAFGDIRNQTARSAGLIATDTNWRTKTRHALARVKNEEDLSELADDFNSIRDDIMTQYLNNVGHILRHAYYTDEQVAIYQQGGGWVAVVKLFLTYYHELLLKLQQEAFKTQDGWSESASIYTEYYSKALFDARNFASSRNLMLFRTYVIVREGARIGWCNIKILEKFQHRISTLSGAPSTHHEENDSSNADSHKKRCKHCNGTSKVHEIRDSGCPFGYLFKKKVAMAKAKQVMKSVGQGEKAHDVITRILQEAISKRGGGDDDDAA